MGGKTGTGEVTSGGFVKKLLDGIKAGREKRDYFTPWGVHAEGISFPSLEKLARDFAQNNKLNLVKMVDFNTKDPSDASVKLEELHRNTGKILQFDEGLAVLTFNFSIHGPDNLEATYGGGPVESYRAKYILSGEISGKETCVIGSMGYSRGCKQEQKTRHFPPHTKYLEWAPKGDFRKAIYRGDREKLWFLIWREKSK